MRECVSEHPRLREHAVVPPAELAWPHLEADVEGSVEGGSLPWLCATRRPERLFFLLFSVHPVERLCAV